MLKLKSYLFILLAGLGLTFTACDKDINAEIVTPPSFARFADAPSVIGGYFVKNDPNSRFPILVGFTDVADRDRTLNFTYTSSTGAEQGVQYNAPSSIVIPAGQSSDSLIIQGLFSGYPIGRRDSLVVTVSSPDAPTSGVYGSRTLILEPYCDVNLAGMEGLYVNTTNSANGSGTPYPMTVTSAVSTGPTTGYIIVQGLFNGTSAPVRVDLDWTNPSNFTTVVNNTSNIYIHPDYGQVHVRPIGTGSFSSCSNTITLSYQRHVAAGNFAANVTRMAR